MKEVKRGKKKRSARLDKVQYGERTCHNDSQTTISNEKDESKRQKRNNQRPEMCCELPNNKESIDPQKADNIHFSLIYSLHEICNPN